MAFSVCPTPTPMKINCPIIFIQAKVNKKPLNARVFFRTRPTVFKKEKHPKKDAFYWLIE